MINNFQAQHRTYFQRQKESFQRFNHDRRNGDFRSYQCQKKVQRFVAILLWRIE